MRLTFTKRSGKHDDLEIDRDGRVRESIQCPKQGIVPHDMVHFAVESTLARRGFFALVADRQSAGFIAAYEHACEARGHAAVPVSGDDVDAVRVRLDQLTADWRTVPVNGSMALEF